MPDQGDRGGVAGQSVDGILKTVRTRVVERLPERDRRIVDRGAGIRRGAQIAAELTRGEVDERLDSHQAALEGQDVRRQGDTSGRGTGRRSLCLGRLQQSGRDHDGGGDRPRGCFHGWKDSFQLTSPHMTSRAAAIYAGLVAAAALTVAPFALGLLTSVTSAGQFATGTPLSMPSPPTLDNYTALGGAGFGRAILVTALMTAIITLGQLVFSVLAAYAFARLDFPGRDTLFWVYVATLMVPATVTVVPLYLMMAEMGLRNTFWALVLPLMFGSPYAIFLLREYFRAIPADLLNAARLDGANTLDVIVHVVLPASKPILATLTLITVVSQWNSFMWPLVITSGPRWRVLTVATAGLQSQYNAQWTLVMAATTVAIVPLVLLFVIFQRHIVRSIVVTGLK